MNKNQKSELVASLKDKLSKSSFVVIVHYRGMTDKQLYDMRVALKAKNCGIKISKNTLAKLAIKGTELEAIESHLSGPTAILYSNDPVALSKAVSDVAKQAEVLKIKVGFLDKALVNESAIKSLASLGSFDEVRASFIGKLKAVQSNFARIINAPNEGLASSFKNEA